MMSSFTIKNFTELEDSAADREGVEARLARSALGADHLGVSLFRYAPGHRASYGHRHREQEEAYVVTRGSGRIKLDDEIFKLRQWDVVRVAPGVIRGFEAGPDGLEFIAVGSDRPEGGDGELVKDWWPGG